MADFGVIRCRTCSKLHSRHACEFNYLVEELVPCAVRHIDTVHALLDALGQSTPCARIPYLTHFPQQKVQTIIQSSATSNPKKTRLNEL